MCLTLPSHIFVCTPPAQLVGGLVDECCARDPRACGYDHVVHRYHTNQLPTMWTTAGSIARIGGDVTGLPIHVQHSQGLGSAGCSGVGLGFVFA